MTSLGVRASDGGSIYRPPNEERYCTLAHLDTEEQILAAAKRTVPQLVSHEQARAAAERTGLNAEQRDAVVMMLTAAAATTVLIAPAGAGKSHTMAEFARLWTTFTGRRVIGLTTSTNAARVLAHEGLAESYNIAEFLGKTEGSDELRRPVPLHRDDVLVLDEASQLATADLAMIRRRPGRPEPGSSPPATPPSSAPSKPGACSGCSPGRSPPRELHEVRRFDAHWERQASIRLRDGDLAAVAAYDRHGRIRGADEEAAYDRAASMWLADHLRGKDVLLLAGSNAEAAELSRRVQAKLTQMGSVGPPQAPLSDGNHAGVGDLVRARLNTEIDAGGRQLTNRDTLKVTAFRGPDAEVRRQRLDGTWTGTFRVPRSYLARNAELAYAGNVHVAQGRTVDTAHLLVTDTPVPAGPVRRHDPRPPSPTPPTWSPARPPRPDTSPTSRPPPNPCSPASCSATRRTCPPPSRSARPRTGPGEPATCSPCGPPPSGRPCTRTSTSRSRPGSPNPKPGGTTASTPGQALQQQAPRRPARRTRHQRAHRPDHRRADGPRPVHRQRPARPPAAARPARPAARRRPGRSAHPPAPRRSPTSSPPGSTTGPAPSANAWPPAPNPGWPASSASSPPARPPRCARNTPAAPAPPPPTAKPPGSPTPNRPSRSSRTAAARARSHAQGRLRRPGDPRRSRHHPRPGPRRARSPALHGQRARSRPPRPTSAASSGSPRKPKPTPSSNPPTPQPEHDQARRSKRHDPSPPSWPPNASASKPPTPDTSNGPPTASTREIAGKATAELQRRGQEPSAGEAAGPQSMATWWREYQAHADAVDRAIEREHQAAIHDGQPWPPERKPEARHEEPDAAPGREPQLEQSRPGTPGASTKPEPSPSKPGPPESETAGPVPADDGRAARLDELQARADEAARRIDAQRAELEASSEHTARIEREAQAGPEADWQAETSYEMDIEL